MSPKETYLLLELVADIYEEQKPKSMSKAIREACEIFERARKNPLAARVKVPLAARVKVESMTAATVRKLAG